MRQILILFTLLCSISFDSAAQDNSFFASMDDYRNNKAIPGVSIRPGSWKFTGKKEYLKLITADTVDWVLASNFPSSIFTIGDILCRESNGKIYYVLVEGKMCCYLTRKAVEVTRTAEGFKIRGYMNNLYPSYSETMDGVIKKLNKPTLKIILNRYGLFEEYDNELKDIKWSDQGEKRESAELSLVLKYLEKYNEMGK